MSETLTFHFEGALSDHHRMNFYESARFQYAAARLMVKLAQFRETGKFVKKITNSSNYNIELVSHAEGSFNINIEEPGQENAKERFITIPLSDLVAYVSERIVEKIDDHAINSTIISNIDNLPEEIVNVAGTPEALNRLVEVAMGDRAFTASLGDEVRDLVKRRISEVYRERRLLANQAAIARIDFPRSQKLIAMSAPLISEMATALRRSAGTLEVSSSSHGHTRSVLFLDQGMAKEIETAIVDDDITTILGDITQFNKDNGWGKLKIEVNGLPKVLSFSIPYDLLPIIKQTLIDHMKKDLVHIQSYFVRDRSGDPIRIIVVGILPTPLD